MLLSPQVQIVSWAYNFPERAFEIVYGAKKFDNNTAKSAAEKKKREKRKEETAAVKGELQTIVPQPLLSKCKPVLVN